MSTYNASHQTTNTATTAIPQVKVMSPPETAKFRRQSHDTGFPESFDEGRTTTLPHPEADLSPNATISHDDVAVDQALKRHKLSFLRKYRKTTNHGIISPQEEALQSVLSLPSVEPGRTFKGAIKLDRPSTSSLRLSKEDGDSLRSKKNDEETPPTSPDGSEHRRKKNALHRLRPKS